VLFFLKLLLLLRPSAFELIDHVVEALFMDRKLPMATPLGIICFLLLTSTHGFQPSAWAARPLRNRVDGWAPQRASTVMGIGGRRRRRRAAELAQASDLENNSDLYSATARFTVRGSACQRRPRFFCQCETCLSSSFPRCLRLNLDRLLAAVPSA
jgi:hypothetical protein